MKPITEEMINKWGMTNMDWMGYTLERKEIFSYHHLRIAKKDNGPMNEKNGAILIQTAGHDYLHRIQEYDRNMFLYLTDILIQINDQKHMPTKEQLIEISNTLKEFETEWYGETTKSGKPLIKQRYLRRKY
jgi:hypothetical protein